MYISQGTDRLIVLATAMGSEAGQVDSPWIPAISQIVVTLIAAYCLYLHQRKISEKSYAREDQVELRKIYISSFKAICDAEMRLARWGIEIERAAKATPPPPKEAVLARLKTIGLSNPLAHQHDLELLRSAYMHDGKAYVDKYIDAYNAAFRAKDKPLRILSQRVPTPDEAVEFRKTTVSMSIVSADLFGFIVNKIRQTLALDPLSSADVADLFKPKPGDVGPDGNRVAHPVDLLGDVFQTLLKGRAQ